MLTLAIKYILPVVLLMGVVGYIHHHGVRHGRAAEKAKHDRAIIVANTKVKDIGRDSAAREAELSAKLTDMQKVIASYASATPAQLCNTKPVKCAVSPKTKGAINDIMGAIKW